MTAASDSRAFNGLGTGVDRSEASTSWRGPIAAAVNLPSGTLGAQLVADTNDNPVIYPYASSGAYKALGFVSSGGDNSSGAQGARSIAVQAQTGTLVDFNAGGGSAFTNADRYSPVYGVDNQTCSKLSTDGVSADVIGMFMGLDTATGNPVVLVDPVLSTILTEITDTGFVLLTTTQTIAGAKLFEAGFLKFYNAGNTFAGLFATNATAARTYTFQDASYTVVGLDTTDSLTNKTLVAPVISTGLTASGSASNDFSASTGTFKTSSGAGTLSGHTTVAAGKNLIMAAGAGNFDLSGVTGVISIGASSATMGFFGQTAAARPSAYTLTYSTASRTSSNITSHTITDSTGGSVSTTALAAQTLPTSPGSGADGTTPNGAQWTAAVTQLTAVRNAIATLAAELVLVKADLVNVKQNAVQAITDLKTLGLLQ